MMPRWPRRWRPGTCQHLISRFVDREYRLADDQDRRAYLAMVNAVHDRWDWRPISYALMSNHVHFGVIAGIDSPARFFGPLHTRYAHYWHRRYGGLGPVFAHRPAGFEIDPTQVGRLVAYHHLNPVNAGVVRWPDESHWTSHRHYVRLGGAPGWLDVELGLSLAGFDESPAGRRQFDRFVREVDFRDRDPKFLADPPQRSTGSSLLMGANSPPEVAPGQWTRLCHLACVVAGVPLQQFGGRTHQASAARRLAATFAYRQLQQPLSRIATALGLSVAATHHLLVRRSRRSSDIEAQLRRLTASYRTR